MYFSEAMSSVSGAWERRVADDRNWIAMNQFGNWLLYSQLYLLRLADMFDVDFQ